MYSLDLEMWTSFHNILAYFEMVHLHSDCVPVEIHGSLMSEKRVKDVFVGDIG